MTKFEQVSDIINNTDMPDLRENVIYWKDGDKFVTVNVSANSRYASRIRDLAEKYPEEARVFSDQKSGYLVGVIPVKAVKLNIVHAAREMSEEEREAVRQRLEEGRRRKEELRNSSDE